MTLRLPKNKPTTNNTNSKEEGFKWSPPLGVSMPYEEHSNFENYKQDTFELATEILTIAEESDSNLKVIFRSAKDGETLVGLVYAFRGSPEYLNSLTDVIDMVNANYDIQNSAKFFSEESTEN